MESSYVISGIVNAGDFMVISLEDTYIQQGVFGGHVNDGTSQGLYAGKIALQILSSPKAPLPKMIENANSWIFDANALEKHAIILPGKIAKESRIINASKTFLQKYAKYLLFSLYWVDRYHIFRYPLFYALYVP